MSTDFELHPRLSADTFFVGSFPLCQVLLMNERRYPWFILVPRISGLVEITDLPNSDQCRLILESSALSSQLQKELRTDKINVAAIGNVVSQLHLHVIARSAEDAAWPQPVWGRFTPDPYAPGAHLDLIQQLQLDSIEGFRFGDAL